jgi:hypothetical protein
MNLLRRSGATGMGGPRLAHVDRPRQARFNGGVHAHARGAFKWET